MAHLPLYFCGAADINGGERIDILARNSPPRSELYGTPFASIRCGTAGQYSRHRGINMTFPDQDVHM
jgi:hypothetical protein